MDLEKCNGVHWPTRTEASQNWQLEELASDNYYESGAYLEFDSISMSDFIQDWMTENAPEKIYIPELPPVLNWDDGYLSKLYTPEGVLIRRLCD